MHSYFNTKEKKTRKRLNKNCYTWRLLLNFSNKNTFKTMKRKKLFKCIWEEYVCFFSHQTKEINKIKEKNVIFLLEVTHVIFYLVLLEYITGGLLHRLGIVKVWNGTNLTKNIWHWKGIMYLVPFSSCSLSHRQLKLQLSHGCLRHGPVSGRAWRHWKCRIRHPLIQRWVLWLCRWHNTKSSQ